ncbi:MAG: Sec-independent protein translocase subunit TatA/TatB [Persicimonas sp.]
MLSGLGLSEILIILLVALVVFGPEKIPDAARTVGKTLRQIRSAGNMFRDMFMLEEGQYPGGGGRQFKDERRRVGAALDGPQEGDPAARRRAQRTRPVVLEAAGTPTDLERIELSLADEANDCHREALTPLRPGARS